MKILYLSHGLGQDYQRDMLFHGLRSVIGPDVVDYPKLDSMYVGADRSKMYGRGFTLYGELPDIYVDRTDIPKKILGREFDIIVYGSIHRCQDYLAEVVTQYHPSRIVFIDGEDHPGYLSGLGGLFYFKRELYNPQPNCYPIQFAIPKSKVLSIPPFKSTIMAPCDPISRKTYIYNTEAEYYAQYASACFGPTMKKAGWDCLRHYEMLSQWCIPYFRVMDQLPPMICEHLPKTELNLVRHAIEYWVMHHSIHRLLPALWEAVIQQVMHAVNTHLTTEALALRVLDTIGVTKTVHSVPSVSETAHAI